MITDNEAFLRRTEELVARLNRKSQPAPPPNMAYNAVTGRWEVPPPNTPHEDEMAADYCTPHRHRSLTAQPQAQPKPIVYAQYDSRYDPDLHPELDAPVQPQPVKTMPAPPPPPAQPVPAEPLGIPVDWPTRIVTPVPLSARE